MKGGVGMKINKGVLAIGLTILSGVLTTVATILDIQDTIDDCRDTYKQEIKSLVDEEFEKRAKTS